MDNITINRLKLRSRIDLQIRVIFNGNDADFAPINRRLTLLVLVMGMIVGVHVLMRVRMAG
jgi:hypothetical protein